MLILVFYLTYSDFNFNMKCIVIRVNISLLQTYFITLKFANGILKLIYMYMKMPLIHMFNICSKNCCMSRIYLLNMTYFYITVYINQNNSIYISNRSNLHLSAAGM